LCRIRVYNNVANPITVLVYDGLANGAARVFMGEYDVPLVADADLVESGRDIPFDPPVAICDRLVLRASEVNACYAIVFGEYTPTMTV